MIDRRIARREGVRKWQTTGDDAEPGRPHQGYDPELGKVAQLDVPGDVEWWAGIAATPYDKRGALVVQRGPFARASCRRSALPDLLAELPEAPGVLPEEHAEPGEHVAVLGPDAVAALLRDATRGPLPSGRRVAASAVNLSQSPAFPRGLPRGDVSPSPVIQDGVAHAGAPVPPVSLVLVGGGAADLGELLAPIERGLYVAAPGLGRRVSGGELGDWVRIGSWADPLGALATVQALTRAQWTIPHGDDPLTVDSTVCPAIRVGTLLL